MHPTPSPRTENQGFQTRSPRSLQIEAEQPTPCRRIRFSALFLISPYFLVVRRPR